EMHAAGATLLTSDGRPWVEVLASAKSVPHFPKKLNARADCTPIGKELYTFAYRGESTAVHSTAGLPRLARWWRTRRAWAVSIELPLASSYTAVAYRSRDVGRAASSRR